MTLPGFIGDYHTHTRFSCDCETEMSVMCEAAIARGLREIAFTDHVDFGPNDPPGYFKPVEYLQSVEQCRSRYGDRLMIRAGAELGEPHLFAKEAQSVLNTGVFDFVIGSAHYAALLPSSQDSSETATLQCAWSESFFEQPLHQAYEGYFRQVVSLAARGEFDVLGHVALVKRDAFHYNKAYDGPGPYADMIRTALRFVIERGKGIEINTSPLYKGKGMTEPCPSLEILRWYRELGGEILTIGSDSHTPEKLASHFEVALELARAAGFTRLATFEGRRVIWNKLE